MFSASLISMMIHSLPFESGQFPAPSPPPPSASAPSSSPPTLGKPFEPGDVTDHLAKTLEQFRDADWPSIPVVGWSADEKQATMPDFGTCARSTKGWYGGRSGAYFWGRIRVDMLIGRFADVSALPSRDEYFDLGTPLKMAAPGQAYGTQVGNLISKTATPTTAKCCVAIVDSSVATTSGGPHDYGGYLNHAVTTSTIDLSDHAERVLYALLDRLNTRGPQQKGILGDVTAVCALVAASVHVRSSHDCFEQDCAPELLDAVTSLDGWLNNHSIPTVVNMSMGTHVGAHDGSSPLEEYVSQTLTKGQERFLVAAAGNDGGKGAAASRSLTAGEREFLTLRTGVRCKELLVEFWWDDSPSANLDVDVDVYELSVGNRNRRGSLTINQSTGTLLTTTTTAFPSTMVAWSLCCTKKSSSMTCIAFALTSPQGTSGQAPPLPTLEIAFALEATRDTIVRAWIVVAEDDPETAFMEGGPQGSISVPASDPKVVGVAGVPQDGQMWHGSSRGPGGRYSLSVLDKQAPLVAHRVDSIGSSCTSIAAPRVAADVAEMMTDATKLGRCQDAVDVVVETYNVARGQTGLPTWHERYGLHKETKL